MKSQPHVVVIKRYSCDDESFRYIMVDNKPNFASARRLASNIKNAIPKDIILVIPIDHISEPEKRARSVYAVNSIGGVVEITEKDYGLGILTKGMSFYACYRNIPIVDIVRRASELMPTKQIVPALCECGEIALNCNLDNISENEINLCKNIINSLSGLDKIKLDTLFEDCEIFVREYRDYNPSEVSFSLASGMYDLLHIPFNNTIGGHINASHQAVIDLIDSCNEESGQRITETIERYITPEVFSYAMAERHVVFVNHISAGNEP